MWRIRLFEEAVEDLYGRGMMHGTMHLSIGQEAVPVGASLALRDGDLITCTHRGHGHTIARGADLGRMMAELLGRENGYCKGRGGSMHIADRQFNNLGANGIVGGGIPIATGAAMGIRVRGTDQVVVCFFSDGASNNGVFAESLNLAGIYALPVVYLLENNGYAVSTPIECSTGCCDLAGRGPAYGVPGACVDGNDAVAVYRATLAAVTRARRGEGPTLIEAKTFRHGGHHVNDPGLYMDPEALAAWKARDPLRLMRATIGEERAAAIEAAVDAELRAAVEFAVASPEPDVDAFLAEVEEA
jgi:pyruvate dehydrogenase E1 component alpha subunit